ncbi:MAG: hypothetical protein QF560_10610, partial [SAR324 cluster bacterium]|nr:hypothetical protein [SAR324 cluster bacterium]
IGSPALSILEVLELIEDILYNRIQGDVSSYSIVGRSLSKMAPDELIELRDFYARQVLTEKRNERLRRRRELVQTF